MRSRFLAAAVCACEAATLLAREQPSRAEAAAPEASPAISTPAGSPPAPPSLTTSAADLEKAGHLQYGASLAMEVLNSAGRACPSAASAPCVLGSGGGLSLRLGYRFHAPFYVGAAYELSKLDANNLLRLPVLQQLRGEARYLPYGETSTTPFVVAGAGVAGYGSEWGLSTLGPLGLVGFGIEAQLSQNSLFTAQLAYRGMRFRPWTDPSGQARAATFASFVGLELGFEQR